MQTQARCYLHPCAHSPSVFLQKPHQAALSVSRLPSPHRQENQLYILASDVTFEAVKEVRMIGCSWGCSWGANQIIIKRIRQLWREPLKNGSIIFPCEVMRFGCLVCKACSTCWLLHFSARVVTLLAMSVIFTLQPPRVVLYVQLSFS